MSEKSIFSKINSKTAMLVAATGLSTVSILANPGDSLAKKSIIEPTSKPMNIETIADDKKINESIKVLGLNKIPKELIQEIAIKTNTDLKNPDDVEALQIKLINSGILKVDGTIDYDKAKDRKLDYFIPYSPGYLDNVNITDLCSIKDSTSLNCIDQKKESKNLKKQEEELIRQTGILEKANDEYEEKASESQKKVDIIELLVRSGILVYGIKVANKSKNKSEKNKLLPQAKTPEDGLPLTPSAKLEKDRASITKKILAICKDNYSNHPESTYINIIINECQRILNELVEESKQDNGLGMTLEEKENCRQALLKIGKKTLNLMKNYVPVPQKPQEISKLNKSLIPAPESSIIDTKAEDLAQHVFKKLNSINGYSFEVISRTIAQTFAQYKKAEIKRQTEFKNKGKNPEDYLGLSLEQLDRINTVIGRAEQRTLELASKYSEIKGNVTKSSPKLGN